jgi:diaminopimelate decarboxylase
MDLAIRIITQFFKTKDGELLIGDVPATELAEKYGTPLYAYDHSVLENKHAILRKTLPLSFCIYYSIKANPSHNVLRFFLAKGCGLEVASAGELQRALAGGCSPENIVFAGPGKTESELDLAIKHHIGELHAESLLEISRIGDISRKLASRTRVSVRVNPSAEAQGGAMRMGGKPAQFGIDEECLDAVVDRLLSEESIDFRGIHLFAGTQILDYTVLVAQYRKAIEIATQLIARLGRPLHTIDFGGGLGIPYFAGDQFLAMDQLASALGELESEVRSDPRFSSTRFIVEPGRYLVGEAGIYLARVIDVKVSRGKKFVIVDGGMNHHLAASGNLGQTIKRNFPVALANKLHLSPVETVDVVGPLCTPLDVLARGVHLPKVDVGDLFAIFQAGAYGYTASPLEFLSHALPAQVWIQEGKHSLIAHLASPHLVPAAVP